jgi:hypothetical protein
VKRLSGLIKIKKMKVSLTIIGVIVVSFFLLTFFFGKTQEPIPAVQSNYKGINARLLRGDEDFQKVLKKAREAGVNWIRTDFSWADIDTGKSDGGGLTLSYSFPDFYVEEVVEKAGFNVLGILNSSPPWANGKSKDDWKCGEPNHWWYLPKDPENFGKYTEEMASRYKNITSWEIWNEPNLYAFNPPVPDPLKYSQLLKAAHKAVKKVNPDALVIGGALGDQPTGSVEIDATHLCGRKYTETNISPEDFLKQMYQSGAKGYFDVLSVHLYGNFDRLENLRQIMLENGDDKPIWVTEVGFSTCLDENDPFCLTKDEQSDRLRKAYEELAKYPYVQKVFYFQFYDTDVPDDKFSYTGLLEGKSTNHKEKPAFQVFKNIVR